MVGVTSIDVKESLNELSEQLRPAETPSAKERLPVLDWLKQDNAPSISAIAKGIGKHRDTVQPWVSQYRASGMAAMWELKKSPRGSMSHSPMGRDGFSQAMASTQSRI